MNIRKKWIPFVIIVLALLAVAQIALVGAGRWDGSALSRWLFGRPATEPQGDIGNNGY